MNHRMSCISLGWVSLESNHFLLYLKSDIMSYTSTLIFSEV